MPSIFGIHKQQRGRIRLVLTSPLIYGMVIPLAFVDICASIYQSVCFPLYGIPRIRRATYVRKIHRGTGLGWLDRTHCAYCSYANGVCAYLRAVLMETEKYWCPIRYPFVKGHKPPHPQPGYAENGDLETLQKVLEKNV